jgi:gliding motility-associated-like protein
MSKTIFPFFLLFFGFVKSQNITVDDTYTPTQLVQDVLVNSGCIQISNVSVSGGNFSNGETSFGYFNANGSALPFAEGVLLTTGKLSSAVGPNSNFSDDGTGINWTGDSDLNTALGLSNTFNATVLEFDFVPSTSQISFEYIFASEQYLSNPSPNQCSYTDGFAFLLKPVGGSSYQNLAVIPGTTTPVRVNTVRGNGTICPPANEAFFDAFNSGNYPTSFDGQTKILTAEAAVTPGILYHIKLVIADEGNARYDSGIFLRAGSFNATKNLGPNRLITTGNPLCPSEILNVNATEIGATNYQWFENRIAIPGATNPIYNINHAGDFSVDITINANCTLTGSIQIEAAPALNINQDLYVQCDTNFDGLDTFNLVAIQNTLFTSLPTGFQIAFFDSPTSTTPLATNFTTTIPYQQIIYARVTNIQTCYGNIPVTLKVNVFDKVFTAESVSMCYGNSITLTAPSGYTAYNWNTNPILNSPSVVITTAGSYTVTITDANGCTNTKTFIVTSSEAATITEVLVNDFEENLTAQILVQGNGDYEYALDGGLFQTNPIFNLAEPGEYQITVNDRNGCGLSSISFFALSYPKFFTPNGDGFNERWRIDNLDKKGLENSRIYIFDRYGKLLQQILASGDGWNGLYNGQIMPSSDYWFVIELTNGRIVKGHFSLKR